MKRMAAFVAATILVIPDPGTAQTAVGFRGGLTLSDISVESDEDIDFESRTGMVVGGFAEFRVGEDLALQLGLSYTQKGGEAAAGEQAFGLELDYLEFPLLAVWSLPTSGGLGARLMGGPVVSFEFSCDRTGLGGLENSLDCETAGFETSSTDFGVQLGGGVVYHVRDAASLFVDGAYNFGLSNWRSDAPGDEVARNRTLLFTVGALFPLR